MFRTMGTKMTHHGDHHLSGPMLAVISLAPLSPWPILLPAMYLAFRRRIRRQLDTLLHNMSVVSHPTRSMVSTSG